jgi:CelD/BcsL family acetyltransferase involved in cellulose biosynthesis
MPKMESATFECYTDFSSFDALRDDWDQFTARFFPDQYARTHGWLSAWWRTYHAGQDALIYVQRSASNGRISAIAPLFIFKDNFGGFPVRSVVTLGRGIGTDDFWASGASEGFVADVIRDLVENRSWDIAVFRRVGAIASPDALTAVAVTSRCTVESVAGDDYLINLPESYDGYFKGLSKNFRQNLRTAVNRMSKAGTVSVRVLDPGKDNSSVLDIGMKIAETSWQFKEGKSHFNTSGSGSFYHNLAGEQLAEGLEFNVLYLDETPVSYLLGYHRGDRFYVIDIAFHRDYKFYSAGHILYTKVIERLIVEKSATQIDLEGAGEYKDEYANTIRPVYSVTIFNRTLYANIIRRARKSSLYEYVRKKIKHR